MMSGALGLEEVQGLLAALRSVDRVAATAEEGGLGVEEVPVVVDEQDVPGTHLGLLSPPARVMGISTWKVVPTPGSESNQMLPLCILTMP